MNKVVQNIGNSKLRVRKNTLAAIISNKKYYNAYRIHVLLKRKFKNGYASKKQIIAFHKEIQTQLEISSSTMYEGFKLLYKIKGLILLRDNKTVSLRTYRAWDHFLFPDPNDRGCMINIPFNKILTYGKNLKYLMIYYFLKKIHFQQAYRVRQSADLREMQIRLKQLKKNPDRNRKEIKKLKESCKLDKQNPFIQTSQKKLGEYFKINQRTAGKWLWDMHELGLIKYRSYKAVFSCLNKKNWGSQKVVLERVKETKTKGYFVVKNKLFYQPCFDIIFQPFKNFSL